MHAAHATTSPPGAADAAAQELLRQQERERQQREQLQPAPDVRLPRTAPSAAQPRPAEPQTPCVPIRRIVLAGDSAERFRFALQAIDGLDGWADAPPCLGARGIDAAMQSVQHAIIARGFVTTRVLAQPQDLKTGTLVLTVVPGRVRAVRIDDGGSHRGTAWNAMPVRPGDVLDLRDIEQGLENFKRLPSAEADIQIVPGEQPGESDVLVRWTQGTPVRLNLSLDDAGSKATGRIQGSATVSYDHWWTFNDLFYLTFNRSLGGGQSGPKGSDGHVVHYSLPWGHWLVGFTGSSNSYRQSVAGFSTDYVYSGDSRTAELRVSRLVQRSAVAKTTLLLAGWTRSSRNFIDDTEIEVQRRRMAGWEAGAAHRLFLGAAVLDGDLAWRRGTGAFGSMPAPEEAFGEGTSRASLLRANAQLQVPLPAGDARLRYGLAWRAQWNRTPLVPQDRFSIGNRYTVRGFDGESTLSAERGWLVRQELSIGIDGTALEVYGGLDHGQVGGPSAALLLGRRLSGGVLGLRGSVGRTSLDAFVSQPIDKPEGFRTAGTAAGFQVAWSY